MRTTHFTAILAAALLLLLLPGESYLYGQQIKWQVISAGGGQGTSTDMKLTGTVGQTGARTGTGGNLKLIGGFLQNFGTAVAPCTRCGDADGNGSINISDVVFIIAFIFAHGSPPGECGQCWISWTRSSIRGSRSMRSTCVG